MRLDCQILLKLPSPLNLLAGSAPANEGVARLIQLLFRLFSSSEYAKNNCARVSMGCHSTSRANSQAFVQLWSSHLKVLNKLGDSEDRGTFMREMRPALFHKTKIRDRQTTLTWQVLTMYCLMRAILNFCHTLDVLKTISNVREASTEQGAIFEIRCMLSSESHTSCDHNLSVVVQ